MAARAGALGTEMLGFQGNPRPGPDLLASSLAASSSCMSG